MNHETIQITLPCNPYDKLMDTLWGTIKDADWEDLAPWEFDMFARLLAAREEA